MAENLQQGTEARRQCKISNFIENYTWLLPMQVSPLCTNVFSLCSSAVFIHTMKDDQRLNTLAHEGDVRSMLHCKKTDR